MTKIVKIFYFNVNFKTINVFEFQFLDELLEFIPKIESEETDVTKRCLYYGVSEKVKLKLINKYIHIFKQWTPMKLKLAVKIV